MTLKSTRKTTHFPELLQNQKHYIYEPFDQGRENGPSKAIYDMVEWKIPILAKSAKVRGINNVNIIYAISIFDKENCWENYTKHQQT